MKHTPKQRAFITLSDPNATEEQWLEALEEVKPQSTRLPFWFTQRRTIDLLWLSESWVGFAAALVISVFQIFFLSFVFPYNIEDLLPFSLSILFAIVRGLTEHKRSSVWHGLSWGLATSALAFGSHMFSPVCLHGGEIWHFLIVPSSIFSYFVARKYAEKMGVCQNKDGPLWHPEPADLIDCDKNADSSKSNFSLSPKFIGLFAFGLLGGVATLLTIFATMAQYNANSELFIFSACALAILLAFGQTKHKSFRAGFNFGMMISVVQSAVWSYSENGRAGVTRALVALFLATVVYAVCTLLKIFFTSSSEDSSTSEDTHGNPMILSDSCETESPSPYQSEQLEVSIDSKQNIDGRAIVIPLKPHTSPYLVAVEELKKQPVSPSERIRSLKEKQLEPKE